jgi:hypothetical protein
VTIVPVRFVSGQVHVAGNRLVYLVQSLTRTE